MNEQLFDVALNEDCLKAFETLPDKCFDLVVTDPPYYIEALAEDLGGSTIRGSSKNAIFHADWDSSWSSLDAFKIWIKKVLVQLRRTMKNKAQCYMFMSYNHTGWLIAMIQELGFTFYKPLIWYKPDTMGIFPNQYGCNYETILWFRKNDGSDDGVYKNHIGNSQRDVFTFNSTNNSARKDAGYHPTAKPKQLIRQLILNGSDEGDLIFDPFGGSGTTAVAAKESGRHFFTVERDEGYFKTIKKRLEQENIVTGQSKL